MGASITMAKGACDAGLFPTVAVSMTGGQESSALGKIESICQGIGVEPEHIRVLLPVPKNHEELCRIIREELEYKGVSVIIPRRVCIQKAARDNKKK